MATFAGIRKKNQNLVKNISDTTRVDQKVVMNVFQYARQLAHPNKPDLIDEMVFTAMMGLRFDITSRYHIQNMFSVLRIKDTNMITIEGFVWMVCVFYSPVLDVKVDYVFDCYDFKRDGKLEFSEISALLKTCILSTGGEDVDPAEVIGDLIGLVFSVTDTNQDGYITREEFKRLVKDDVMCIQLLGQVLPAQNIIDRFMVKMETSTPLHIKEYFVHERSVCLNEPITRSKPKNMDKEFPGVTLDFS